MPGSSPYEAFNAFITPLVDALNCVVQRPSIAVSQGGRAVTDVRHLLFLTGHKWDNDGYLAVGGGCIELRARMKYMIIEDERDGYGPFRVTTRGYDYSVRTRDGAAVLDYHWHPTGLSHEKRPHLHIGSAQLSHDSVLARKQHLCCGRVTLEAVIRNLINNQGVKPLTLDWSDLLDLCETPHILHRSWSMDYEQETGCSVPEDEPESIV